MKASGQGSVAVAKEAAQTAPAKSLAQYLQENRSQIDKVKPKHLDTERFLGIVVRAVYSNPQLAKCSIKSILLAAIESAKLGLEPGGVLGHAALVPYWSSKKDTYEAQFQLMYKGGLTLAYNTGMFKVIDAREVCENDEFDYSYGFETTFKHIPAESERGPVKGFYAFFVLKSGGTKFEYMSAENVRKWAENHSKAYEDTASPWHTFFPEMGKKTVLWKVLRMAPLRIELPVDQEDIDAYGLKPNYQIGEDTIVGEFEEVVPEEKSPEVQEGANKDNTSEGKSQEEPPVAGPKEPKQPELL